MKMAGVHGAEVLKQKLYLSLSSNWEGIKGNKSNYSSVAGRTV